MDGQHEGRLKEHDVHVPTICAQTHALTNINADLYTHLLADILASMPT